MSKPRRPRRPVTGILLLDKPLGLSSNQALQQVKRLYQAEKAGHTGSLDPLATGMLPICLGEATKLSGVLLDSDKNYQARIRLGERTDTGDAEGEVIQRCDAPIDRSRLERTLAAFRGTIKQVPPMYSALKHKGERLYALARQGQEVERSPREVNIAQLELTDWAPPELSVSVTCSKGTYIRTLAEDIAAACGQCAHLRALRRTAVAPFVDAAMVSIEQVEAAAAEGFEALDALLLSPAEGLRHWPQLRIDPERAAFLAQGQAVRVADVPRECRVAVLDEGGRLLGLADSGSDGMVAPRRWLRQSVRDACG
ncbi:MAG: tRNA pseudouridine(55) synthase TruB [Nevskiales bacterium]|nr:tRNA pseudouridine(55) synthase TruB [Nevskiales bacterium]